MDNPRAKWCQRQLGDLEELFPEGDSDNGTAPEATNHKIVKRHPQSAADKPDDIGQGRERSASVQDLLPERPEGQAGKLKALAAKRNTDHRNAAQQSGNQPQKAADEPAENKPQDITDRFHFTPHR